MPLLQLQVPKATAAVEAAAAAAAHAADAGRHILCHFQQAAAAEEEEVEEAVAEASKSRLLHLMAVVAEVGAAVDPRRWGSSWLRLTVGNEGCAGLSGPNWNCRSKRD